jgi:sugar lactone lactonase YvrE
MLFGTDNAPARTFFKMAAVLLFLQVGGVGSAFAANTGAPPQLVPYMQYLVAGNSPAAVLSGFGGDNGPAVNATMSTAQTLAVDSAGNIYFPDLANAVIREINAQTGVVTTVGGTPPTSCTGTSCSASHSGCSDGVPALGASIGTGNDGIAVDGYGNVFFVDRTSNTASVIYRGGAQVAAFIALVNPAGITASGGAAQPGYVYHIIGNINYATCVGKSANLSGSPVIPYGDNGPAFSATTTAPAFNSLQSIHLDGAGNIYLEDAGANLVRVVNTQSVPQTIFGQTIPPGYINSILPCSGTTSATTETSLCQVQPSAGPTVATFGEGGPAGGFEFQGLGASNNDGDEMDVDAYGNVYILNGDSGPNSNGPDDPFAVGIAYAGGSAVANMIANANASNVPFAGMSSLPPATPGDMYIALQGAGVTRPAGLSVDKFGNMYNTDHNHHILTRVDVNASSNLKDILANTTFNATNTRAGVTGTPANPVFCYPYNGQVASNPVLSGYQTTDLEGNGCPGLLGAEFATSAGTAVPDGMGNLWAAIESAFSINEFSLGNQFPAAPIGRAFNPTTLAGQQTIDIHFDVSNLPATVAQLSGGTNFTTAAATTFAIAPGSIPDFTINPISTTFFDAKNSYLTFPFPYDGGSFTANLTQIATPGGITSPPICKGVYTSPDQSIDCLVNVIFSPTAPGLRQSQLVVTTANGSVYNFALSGLGVGGQLAIDGGAQQTIFTSTATSTPSVPAVAVGPTGTVYIADPANNQVVAKPAGSGTPTTVGTGLKGPMGVAVDIAGNVYISDTGNNRILEVALATTGAQTVLGGVLAAGTPAYAQWPVGPQYSLNAPQGIAVDALGNVYVADTGNKRIVEIPNDTHLGPATPMFQYPGAPTFINPVAVAVDGKNNLYIADTGNATGQIVKVPPGGGDLQNIPTALTIPAASVGNSFTKPNGVAVDGGGNVYVSDSGTNLVYEAPSGSGATAAEFALTSFTGLKAPAGIAVDQSGNLYVADSGNGRVLFDNRQSPAVQFGTVPQNQPAATTTLTVTNIGTTPVTLASPFTSVTGTANPVFALPASSASKACSNSSPLAAGTTCSFTATFLPTSDGLQTETVSVDGGTQTATLNGSGEQPLVKLVLSNTPSTGAGVTGTAITVTATLTQPNISGDTPSGAVTFSYTVDGGAAVPVTPVPMATGSGGTSTASFTIPASAVLQGRIYVVSAAYQGDAQDSPTTATPLTIQVPGVSGVTATSSSTTFVYGGTVPALTGTVTGITDPSVTYKFVTAASPTTPIGVYPITVTFAGGTYLNYGFPLVTTSAGVGATVTETAAPLAVTANNATTVYGAAPLTYTSVITGTQNGDKFAEEYTPANSSLEQVGTYSLVPTVEGSNIGNYTVKVTNGTLTVVQAPTTITVATPVTSAPACTLLVTTGCNGILASTVIGPAGGFTVTVSTLVASGLGTPSGTVTITDTFTPITATAPGTGTPTQTTIGPLTLAAGAAKYSLTNAALGTHVYSFAYSGDSNFQASNTASTPSILTVDNADFTVSQVSTASGVIVPSATPVQIVPGVIPGGNSSVAGEQSAYPEQATIAIDPFLGMSGTVTLSCTPQNPSYVSCSIAPAALTTTAGSTTALTAIISVSTPASLPLNFNFGASAVFLPLGGILVIGSRRRRKLSKALWLTIVIAAISVGMTACGGNSVTFYTPVPSGVQYVTVTATGTSPTTSTVVARSFQLPISIQ